MIRINYNGTYKDVQPTDASYRLMEVGAGKMVSLSFALTELIDFPIGSYIIVDNQRYETFELFPYTMINERHYDYVIAFYDDIRSFENFKFRNHVDGRLKFTLTAKPREYVEHVCRNLNAHSNGVTWTVGDCIDCTERTQSFSHNTIREALDSIAALFDTEWEIRGNQINLRKTEYNKAAPLELSYGMGNGFKSGIGREMSEEKAVDVLFVEGGERNIDQSKYTYQKEIEGLMQTLHADTLRLPKNGDFIYFPPETEEIIDPDNIDYGTLYDWASSMPSDLRAKGFHFKTDADGFSIYRAENVANGYEDSLDLTDIYPMREETISNVLTEDGRNVYDNRGNIINTDEHHFYDIVFAEDVVDYSDKTIWESGSEVSVIFQKGMLMGKEFKVTGYVKAERRLKIQPQDVDGLKMPDPSSGYMPKIGEKVAVFHINLPNEYIRKAEKEMALQSAHYLWKHTEPEIKFNGVVDGIWAKKNWLEISNKIGLGYYVKFTHPNIAPNGKLMRIIGIKDYINKPHSPELTLSNISVAQGISTSSVTTQLKKAAQNEVYTTKTITENLQFTKRTFRDTEETMRMIEDAFKTETDNIKDNITDIEGDITIINGDIYDSHGNLITDLIIDDIDNNVKVNINGLYEQCTIIDGKLYDSDGHLLTDIIFGDLAIIDGKIVRVNQDIANTNEDVRKVRLAFQGQYTEGIQPSAVHTMQLLVGDASLQFEFGQVTSYYQDNKTVAGFQTETWEPTWNRNTRELSVNTTLILRHTALIVVDGENNVITSSVPAACYPYWQMMQPSSGKFTIPANKDDTPYYLYAVVSKDATNQSKLGKVQQTGQFYLSETKMSYETANNYYLMVGILNSANYDGSRSFASVYGFTEILGNRITTDLIRSSDGQTYFDLKHNVIAGKILFKDGLISNRIWIGSDENTAIAGLGGLSDNYNLVVWAGKNGDNYRFRLYESGLMIFCDDNGNRLMQITPELGHILCNTIYCYDEIHTEGNISAAAISATSLNCSNTISGKFRPKVSLRNGYTAEPNTMFVPVWIGYVYFSNNDYHSYFVFRARVTKGSTTGNFNISAQWRSGIDDGWVQIDFDYPFTSADDYFVTTQGKSLDNYSDPHKPNQANANIRLKHEGGFYVTVSDDETTNNHDFWLQIWARTT